MVARNTNLHECKFLLSTGQAWNATEVATNGAEFFWIGGGWMKMAKARLFFSEMTRNGLRESVVCTDWNVVADVEATVSLGPQRCAPIKFVFAGIRS
ncbi:hypothetical protein XpopCFBP1817_02645 [Xanthomonas populi]|uniref:Uncharacterized protein n=1 Tax=Xanthomonas populi TaxID=53414 RepID=A0A2S7F2D2_9XANT|nr:hypothetical protein XpopCFBP1817_02645 [Xanthomonas populi]